MGVSSALERQREVKVEKSSYSASSVGHFCYVFSLNRSAVTVECIPGCTLPDSFTIALLKNVMPKGKYKHRASTTSKGT